MQTTDIEQSEKIYTVSRLNYEVRFLLEDTYPFVWVEGEISNFAAPHSGHWYFSLKDSTAQVRCAMFRGSQRKLTFSPKDGMHILIKARVSLYENRGEFQLIAEDMEERGEGKLRRAYEVLKKKLEAAGLFDPAHKKPLPGLPKRIGVITSATGAAIRDILTVLKRRYACVPVIIYPTLVQGAAAAPAIVNAIQVANRRNECDILILSRGGGPLEDLWPFNEERVAHAIYHCEIPIISGVGHEVDFTIADFVADKRAPTPSAAAEIATPDRTDLLQLLARSKQQILRRMQHKVSASQQEVSWIVKHLYQQHPKRKLTEKMQRLDFFEFSLVQLQTRLISKLQARSNDADLRLHRQIPIYRINTLQHQLNLCQQQLNNLAISQINKYHTRLANAAAKLDALSPLATLKRGYAIATTKDHHVLNDASKVKVSDEILVQLSIGSLTCVVEKVKAILD
jgi:exodeoxyribonuclease VII large subunit